MMLIKERIEPRDLTSSDTPHHQPVAGLETLPHLPRGTIPTCPGVSPPTKPQVTALQHRLPRSPGAHVTQIGRYESGTSAPTLDVLRNLAVALNVSTDSLIFGDTDRGPDEDLRLVFESASRLDDEGKKLLKAVIEGVILRQETRRIQTEAS